MGLFGKLFGKGAPKEDTERIQTLLAQCDQEGAKEREEACKALGGLAGQVDASHETITEKMLELINDDDGDVCNAAADAYAKIERGFV